MHVDLIKEPIILLKGCKNHQLSSRIKEIDSQEISFISENAYVASCLWNGKIIGNGVGSTKVNIFNKEQFIQAVEVHVLPSERRAHPVLVNRRNGVPKAFVPSTLVKVEKGTYNWNIFRDIYICEEAKYAYTEMAKDALKDNVVMGVNYAYRSRAEQQILLDKSIQRIGVEATLKKGAPAGFSEHHTGMAMDVSGMYRSNGEKITPNKVVYQWLADYCHEYGFMIKNLKGKEHITGTQYEPWHIRYIGDQAVARLLHDNYLTLDEYLNYVDENEGIFSS